MGEVAIVYKIMPDGPEVDLDNLQKSIKETIPDYARLNKIEIKPVAFGLKALEVQIILDDKKGGAEDIERSLGEIDNVQSIEAIHVGLL
jgi:elongation factor 1-beta